MSVQGATSSGPISGKQLSAEQRRALELLADAWPKGAMVALLTDLHDVTIELIRRQGEQLISQRATPLTVWPSRRRAASRPQLPLCVRNRSCSFASF